MIGFVHNFLLCVLSSEPSTSYAAIVAGIDRKPNLTCNRPLMISQVGRSGISNEEGFHCQRSQRERGERSKICDAIRYVGISIYRI